MNIDTPYYTALTALVTASWGIPAARILSLNQAARINWQNETEAGNLAYPLAIISLMPDVEEAVITDGNCYRQPTSITYIRLANLSAAEVTAGTNIRSVLEGIFTTMRDAFRTFTGTAFQLFGTYPTKTIAPEDPINHILFALNARYEAVTVNVSPLIGQYD